MAGQWKYYTEEEDESRQKQPKYLRCPPQANYVAAVSYIKKLLDSKKINWAAMCGFSMKCFGSPREVKDIHLVVDGGAFGKIKKYLEKDSRSRIPNGMNSLFPTKVLVGTGPSQKDYGCVEEIYIEVNLVPSGSHGTPPNDVLAQNQIPATLSADGKMEAIKSLNLFYLVRTTLVYARDKDISWDPRVDIAFLCERSSKEVASVRQLLSKQDLYECFFWTAFFANSLSPEHQRLCSRVLLDLERPHRPARANSPQQSSPAVMQSKPSAVSSNATTLRPPLTTHQSAPGVIPQVSSAYASQNIHSQLQTVATSLSQQRPPTPIVNGTNEVPHQAPPQDPSPRANPQEHFLGLPVSLHNPGQMKRPASLQDLTQLHKPSEPQTIGAPPPKGMNPLRSHPVVAQQSISAQHKPRPISSHSVPVFAHGSQQKETRHGGDQRGRSSQKLLHPSTAPNPRSATSTSLNETSKVGVPSSAPSTAQNTNTTPPDRDTRPPLPLHAQILAQPGHYHTTPVLKVAPLTPPVQQDDSPSSLYSQNSSSSAFQCSETLTVTPPSSRPPSPPKAPKPGTTLELPTSLFPGGAVRQHALSNPAPVSGLMGLTVQTQEIFELPGALSPKDRHPALQLPDDGPKFDSASLASVFEVSGDNKQSTKAVPTPVATTEKENESQQDSNQASFRYLGFRHSSSFPVALETQGTTTSSIKEGRYTAYNPHLWQGQDPNMRQTIDSPDSIASPDFPKMAQASAPGTEDSHEGLFIPVSMATTEPRAYQA